jgi:small conductance mechanosensitive channel
MSEMLDRLGLGPTSISNWFWETAPTLIAILIAIVVSVVFYYSTARFFRTALLKTNMQRSLVDITIKSLYRWTIIIIVGIFILGQLGFDITAAIAGVGVAGIAIGFAAKETLANIMSGFGIFIDRLYNNGDWVEIAGKYGQVKDITLRTTKIRNLDNIFIIIPNADVTTNPVINYSEEGMVRITVKIGIAYHASLDLAREVLLSAVSTIEGVRAEPTPEVVVDELDDSSINLLIRVWVDDAGSDQHFRFTLTETCKRALDEANIEIPFPQRVVHHVNP